MRHRVTAKSIKKLFWVGLFTPLALACLWLGVIASNYSIFPTNTYSAYKGWYQPGNAVQVNNHYSLDINFIYVPWKLYLATHSPQELACETSAPSFTPGHQGIKLPDQSCFPLATSRLYTVIDPRRWLEKVLPFFAGYDLGYLLLAILIWLTAAIALWKMRFKVVPIILGAAVSLETFWLSKELQYDQYSAPVPFLYLAIACLVGAEKKRLNNLWYVTFAGLAFVSLLFTSLQGIVLCGVAFFIVLISYFVARGWPLLKDQHFWIRLLASTTAVYSAIAVLLIPSFAAFLEQSQRYIKLTSYSEEIVLTLKRAILPFLTLITIPTANLFGNFDTIDPWKSLGWFGGREYVSVDTLTLYSGSLYALVLVFVLCLTWQKHSTIRGLFSSSALKFWLISFSGAWLLCTLPTYKFLYFRLIQFAMGFGAPIFVALALEEIGNASEKNLSVAFKKLVVFVGGLWGLVLIAGQIEKADSIKNAVLNKLGSGGVLGFEPGFWQFRYQRFVERLSLQDPYSITLLVSQLLLCAVLYAYITHYHQKPLKRSATAWVAVLLIAQTTMLVDSVWHVWNWNWPQPVRTEWITNHPYWRQKGASGLTEISPDNAPTPQPNFLILYGEQPPFFYESLNVKPERK